MKALFKICLEKFGDSNFISKFGASLSERSCRCGYSHINQLAKFSIKCKNILLGWNVVKIGAMDFIG